MSKLLSDLDAKAGKTPYQTYTISHGIERIGVMVPLKNAAAFEARLSKGNLPTRQAVLEVLAEFGGALK